MSGSDCIAGAQQLVDQHQILNTLATHSRGVDRSDSALMKTAYHSDAEVAYGIFSGNAHEFCDTLTQSTRQNPVSMHRHNNIWIKQGPVSAVSESYVIAFSQRDDGDGPIQSLIGGRYLDRHDCRDGAWKMSYRTFVLEWNLNLPGTGSALPGFQPIGAASGLKGADDLSFPHAENIHDYPDEKSTEQDMVEMSRTIANQIEAALARTEIHNLIMAHCRAADRRDMALLREIWEENATLHAGEYEGNALELLLSVLESQSGYKKMFHSVSNEWIRIDGDNAIGESYGIVFLTSAGDVDELMGRRYLDRFRRKDGIWKFVHRTIVQDWQMDMPSTDESEQGMYSQLRLRGGLYPDDPVYALWETA